MSKQLDLHQRAANVSRIASMIGELVRAHGDAARCQTDPQGGPEDRMVRSLKQVKGSLDSLLDVLDPNGQPRGEPGQQVKGSLDSLRDVMALSGRLRGEPGHHSNSVDDPAEVGDKLNDWIEQQGRPFTARQASRATGLEFEHVQQRFRDWVEDGTLTRPTVRTYLHRSKS